MIELIFNGPTQLTFGAERNWKINLGEKPGTKKVLVKHKFLKNQFWKQLFYFVNTVLGN